MTPTLRARIEAAALDDIARHPGTVHFCHTWDAAAKAAGCAPKVAEPVVLAMLHAGRIVRVGEAYAVGEARG